MMGNEAMYMLMEGVAAAEDIDTEGVVSIIPWVRSNSVT